MQKHAAWAAATNSSGLVFPPESSVLAAQLTGRSVNNPLLTALTTPPPDMRSPSQVASALRTASICLSLLEPKIVFSWRPESYHTLPLASALKRPPVTPYPSPQPLSPNPPKDGV